VGGRLFDDVLALALSTADELAFDLHVLEGVVALFALCCHKS